MGTINYKTSNIITLGFKPLDFDKCRESFIEDTDDIESYTGEEINQSVQTYIDDLTADFEAEAQGIIDKYDFHNIRLSLEAGYYEGFYLDIKDNNEIENYSNDVFIYTLTEFLEDIETLRKCLIDLIKNSYLTVCFPSWSTGYIETLDENVEAIENTIAAYATRTIKAVI